MFGSMYYGSYIILIPAMIFAFIAQNMVKSNFKKYSKIGNSRGMTGAEVAALILSNHGLSHVKVEPLQGKMTDHYDPRHKAVRLSEGVYNARSIAALSIAAHECGHAIQHDESYAYLSFREFMFPAVNLSNRLAMPIAVFGIFIGYIGINFGIIFLQIGILLFSVVVLFQLVTLPVEFNASKRAITILEEYNYLNPNEVSGAKRMLNAAAMTYVAAAATALSSLLRLIMIARRR